MSEDNDVMAERIRANGDSGKQDVLRVLDVVKVYQGRHRAVDNVSFGIPKGECFGLLGVNGAGKTTLFRILTGQLQPTEGTTFVQDTRLDKVFSKGTQLVGYCPQADALDDLLSPTEHLVVYSMMRGIPKSDIKKVVDNSLSRFQLTHHANHRVGTLSRGTRRKVCTAISMLGNPQIVLLAHHYNIVEFSLPSKQTSLSSVFKFLETNATELGILDFSVSQTTLDQVFVNFARQQSDASVLQLEQEMPLPLPSTAVVTDKDGLICDELSTVNVHQPDTVPTTELCHWNCEATKF
ncbi:hypothetical protein HPB48_006756 [Haemaphysalis longicornis]|uniref:ABC transporter domain-containing protein n=1 Tax=Haemaphysalis longicornis TaxID=44386 RepID=A0A9J6FW13_HAELO|nr:hypothetical protein HPB48_006756 [Haemaphysalis longicornis]